MAVRVAAVWLLLAGVQLAAAEERPLIREIAYEGNAITEPLTMQRELVIAVGDPADPNRIERSRQAIQDLGLFREVTVREEPINDDGVRLVFTLREKWYVIPLPRVEANSDGDTGYGGQLRWNNLWGLNHRLELLAVQRDFKREDKDSSTNFFTNYNIPFLGQSRNALNISASYNEQDSTSEEGFNYRERSQRLAFVFSRALTDGPASQGWKAGGGLAWQDQQAFGDNAPATFGTAIGPVASLSFNDLHDHLYSETGESFATSVALAVDGLGSDYGYVSHFTRYHYERAVGRRDHQTLRAAVELGGYHGGPSSRDPDAFEFGGSTKLRGYDREIIDGDIAYYASLDYLRPLNWNWLRGLATLEVGSALNEIDHPGGRLLYASVGAGLTFRVTWLVNVNFEIGVAYPLVEGDGLRFFARAL
ncbi:MAG: POTRA domain-containing protein [Panacagrimonas sp.]